jgi:hypothetical protein
MALGKQTASLAALGAAMLIGSGLSAPPAQATPFVVTLEQVGSNVVETGSGAIDLTGLTFVVTNPVNPTYAIITPLFASLGIGPTGMPNQSLYSGISGPTNFGTGGQTNVSSGTGDPVAIFGFTHFLDVPAGYFSNTTLMDTATFTGQTFASLGVTPGTYEWMWGTGADQNFTLQIGAAAVPAPLIGHGLPALLAVGGLLFGAKLLDRGKRRRLQFG